MPFDLIVAEVIPSLFELIGPEDANKIVGLFETDGSATAVYFDHKIADPPSTLLNALSFGYIPTKKTSSNNFDFASAKTKNFKSLAYLANLNAGVDLGGKIPQFHPFINYCLTGQRPTITLAKALMEDENDFLRCPYAWYKKINYDTGTYNGPGANVLSGAAGTAATTGGRRRSTRKKRRTRKLPRY